MSWKKGIFDRPDWHEDEGSQEALEDVQCLPGFLRVRKVQIMRVYWVLVVQHNNTVGTRKLLGHGVDKDHRVYF